MRLLQVLVHLSPAIPPAAAPNQVCQPTLCRFLLVNSPKLRLARCARCLFRHASAAVHADCRRQNIGPDRFRLIKDGIVTCCVRVCACTFVICGLTRARCCRYKSAMHCRRAASPPSSPARFQLRAEDQNSLEHVSPRGRCAGGGVLLHCCCRPLRAPPPQWGVTLLPARMRLRPGCHTGRPGGLAAWRGQARPAWCRKFGYQVNTELGKTVFRHGAPGTPATTGTGMRAGRLGLAALQSLAGDLRLMHMDVDRGICLHCFRRRRPDDGNLSYTKLFYFNFAILIYEIG